MTDKPLKAKVDVALSDAQLRQVRTYLTGRGGRATRREIRIWVSGLVKAATDRLPEPKRRTVKAEPVVEVSRVDANAVCATCGNVYGDHSGRLRHCPLSKRVKPGARFVLSVEETDKALDGLAGESGEDHSRLAELLEVFQKEA